MGGGTSRGQGECWHAMRMKMVRRDAGMAWCGLSGAAACSWSERSGPEKWVSVTDSLSDDLSWLPRGQTGSCVPLEVNAGAARRAFMTYSAA